LWNIGVKKALLAHIESLYILGDNLLARLLLSKFHMSGVLDENPIIFSLMTHYQKPLKENETLKISGRR